MTAPRNPIARPCACGCGAPVTRRYKPGHDARHKSALVAALVGGTVRMRASAADQLADLGWTEWADPADLRAVPYVTPRGRAIPRLDEVATWQVDHLGGHHAHRTCPRLTQAARLVGGTNAITRLASDAYVTLTPNTPECTSRLPLSWDLCVACSTPTDRLEQASLMVITRQATWAGDLAPKITERTPRTWTILLDDDTDLEIRVALDPVTHKITRTYPAIWAPPVMAA